MLARMEHLDGGAAESGSYIQSVGRAAAVLRCFSTSDGALNLSELARRTGLTTSTTYRLLHTLLAEGFVARENGTERYLPGPVLVALAHNAFVSGGFPSALQVLEHLAEVTRESATLGVRRAECVVMLLQASSPEPFRFEEPTGTLVPMHSAALGKALLAFGAVSIPDAVRGLGALPNLTQSTLSGDHLERDLEAALERGYTVAHDEQVVGVTSVAAPILGSDGRAHAAVGIQGPTVRLTTDRILEVGQAVRQAAAALQALPIAEQLSRLSISPS
jgi:IclR family transcriptional regulator, acetate operon repressor